MTEEAKQRIHSRTLEMRQAIIDSHTEMLDYIENYEPQDEESDDEESDDDNSW